jgi:hypothetical protein
MNGKVNGRNTLTGSSTNLMLTAPKQEPAYSTGSTSTPHEPEITVEETSSTPEKYAQTNFLFVSMFVTQCFTLRTLDLGLLVQSPRNAHGCARGGPMHVLHRRIAWQSRLGIHTNQSARSTCFIIGLSSVNSI